MIYVDSSVLLAEYLDQPSAPKVRALLATEDELVSSVVLAAEVPVVLRRALAGKDRRTTRLREGRLERFDEDLRRISLLVDMTACIALIREDARFCQARTLDALHAAAARQFHEEASGRLVVATGDRRLASLCGALGLDVETVG